MRLARLPRSYMPEPKGQLIANGPDAVRAYDAVRRAQNQRDAWPFPHVYPPLNSQRRDPNDVINAPNQGAANQALILSFQVPSGMNFFMDSLGLFYKGEAYNGWTAFVFTVDVDTPLGTTPFQGVPITDWDAIKFPLGDPVFGGPVRLSRVELFSPEQTIRAKVVNNSITPGAANTFGAWFGGWLVPAVENPNAE